MIIFAQFPWMGPRLGYCSSNAVHSSANWTTSFSPWALLFLAEPQFGCSTRSAQTVWLIFGVADACSSGGAGA